VAGRGEGDEGVFRALDDILFVPGVPCVRQPRDFVGPAPAPYLPDQA